jgi:hypothetical protein
MPSHTPVNLPAGGLPGVLPHVRPGALATLPDWWAVLNAGSNAQAPEGATNFSDKRFPISRAIAPTDLLPVVYGAARVGGSEIFYGTTPGGFGDQIDGTGVLAWCEGPIQSIDAFLVNGQPLTTHSTDSGSITVTNYLGATGDYHHDGDTDVFGRQGYNPISGLWATPAKNVTGFANVAYTYFRALDPHSGGWWAWLPNFSAGTFEWAADVHGLLLYDPRSGLTVYSNNPALIFRDMLRRFGHLTDAQIDDVSIAVAATACDTIGFTCNVAFAVKTPLDQALAVVLQTCNGKKITTASGKTGLYLNVPNAGAPVATFSEEDGDVWALTYEWISARDRYTRVAVSFADSAADYKQNQTPDFDDPGIALGTVPIKAQVVAAPGINTMAAAVILRDFTFNIQAITFRTSGSMNAKGIPLQEGQKIRLATFKLTTPLDVILNQIAGDEKGFFSFVAQPYDASVFGSTPLSGGGPIIVINPNPALAGNDVTITSSSATRPVVVDSPSNVTLYNLFQLVTYTLPPDGPPLRELRVRGFRGTGAGTKTWEDMIASEIVVPLTGNEPVPDATHFTLSHPGVPKIIRTLTYDPFGRLKNTAEVIGPTRLMIRTVTTAYVLSAGVTVDVAGSTTSVDASLPAADIGRGTIIERPTGTINGVNRLFTLSKTPSSSRILLISDNMPLVGGLDYSRDAAAVRFAAAANKPSSNLLAVYTYGDISDGGGTPELSLPIGTAATWSGGTLAAKAWTTVAFSPTLRLWAAINSSGTSDAVYTSPDGITWTARTIPTTPVSGGWTSLCWGNGKFVAINYQNYNAVLTSTDGVTWTQGTYAATIAYVDTVIYAASIGLYVASSGLSSFPTATRSMTSSDASTWTLQTSQPWTGMCWAPELALFVAVGTNAVYTSSNSGVTWTAGTISARAWKHVTWSPELGLFVACSTTIGSGAFATSPDGFAWTDRTCGLGSWTSVEWSPIRRLFVADSSTADAHAVATSPDGVTWTVQATPSPMNAGGWGSIAVGDSPDIIVALSFNAPYAMRSLA